jgi:hypothetical protein
MASSLLTLARSSIVLRFVARGRKNYSPHFWALRTLSMNLNLASSKHIQDALTSTTLGVGME